LYRSRGGEGHRFVDLLDQVGTGNKGNQDAR
jgi:hypothetical protein